MTHIGFVDWVNESPIFQEHKFHPLDDTCIPLTMKDRHREWALRNAVLSLRQMNVLRAHEGKKDPRYMYSCKIRGTFLGFSTSPNQSDTDEPSGEKGWKNIEGGGGVTDELAMMELRRILEGGESQHTADGHRSSEPHRTDSTLSCRERNYFNAALSPLRDIGNPNVSRFCRKMGLWEPLRSRQPLHFAYDGLDQNFFATDVVPFTNVNPCWILEWLPETIYCNVVPPDAMIGNRSDGGSKNGDPLESLETHEALRAYWGLDVMVRQRPTMPPVEGRENEHWNFLPTEPTPIDMFLECCKPGMDLTSIMYRHATTLPQMEMRTAFQDSHSQHSQKTVDCLGATTRVDYFGECHWEAWHNMTSDIALQSLTVTITPNPTEWRDAVSCGSMDSTTSGSATANTRPIPSSSVSTNRSSPLRISRRRTLLRFVRSLVLKREKREIAQQGGGEENVVNRDDSISNFPKVRNVAAEPAEKGVANKLGYNGPAAPPTNLAEMNGSRRSGRNRESQYGHMVVPHHWSSNGLSFFYPSTPHRTLTPFGHVWPSATQAYKLRSDLLSSRISSWRAKDLRNIPKRAAEAKLLRIAKSHTHGFGLFAGEGIPRGAYVMEYVGELVPRSAMDERESAHKRSGIGSTYMFALDFASTYILDGTKRGGIARFINHSCSPNCETKSLPPQTRGDKPHIFIASIQNILPGQELTYNYRTSMAEATEKCLCGASDCRGWI